jgi:SAM-dependent methyltransferase
MSVSCNLCGGAEVLGRIDFGRHPVAHHYLRSATDDAYTHPFILQVCGRCGHAFLADPIAPEVLYKNYITLSDWKYQPHIPRIIDLIRSHCSGVEASILEVGSNDGRFLESLAGAGFRRILGIEPAEDARDAASARGVETIEGFFDRRTAQAYVDAHGLCDVLIARQVLEHVGDLAEFGAALTQTLVPGGHVVIEVPDFACNLETLDYGLWEEHVNYFTSAALHRFFAGLGIEVVHEETILFSGRTLVMVGRRVEGAAPSVPTPADLLTSMARYLERWPVFRDALRDWLRQRAARGRVAIYGAGNRASSLVNFSDTAEWIEFFVDDQTEKQGLFMPGSRLPILPSDSLHSAEIDLCLLAVNAEIETKVMARHESLVERGGEFFSILPPSDRLPLFWSKLS